jgi:hypothetical protein
MKKISLAVVMFGVPTLLLAQSDSYAQTLAAVLAPKLSLWSAIIVAFATSVMVFMNAYSMKGGIFGTALNYFGVGMILILAGFIVTSFNLFNSGDITATANNILFILGYIIMALAAHKLSQIVHGK